MNWRDLLAKVGIATREDEEPKDLEARADALTAAFPDDDAFVAEQLKAGNGVPEAVAAMKANHAKALADARAEAATALAKATADADAIRAELADAQARIVQLESLPHEGAEPVATTVPDATPKGENLDHLTPAQAKLATSIKLPNAKKEV